jgi:hypothetical protein
MWIDSIVLVHVQSFGCHCTCSLKGCWVFRTEQKWIRMASWYAIALDRWSHLGVS